MTLPLIHMLNQMTWIEKRRVMNVVRNHNNEPHRVAELITKVNSSGGIEYAAGKMREYQQKAMDLLFTMPDSESRRSLEQLVIFTTERKH
jgi:octaprenyl-diphosphate synthase